MNRQFQEPQSVYIVETTTWLQHFLLQVGDLWGSKGLHSTTFVLWGRRVFSLIMLIEQLICTCYWGRQWV